MELKKRKGLFYTADALLAVSILFIFMLLAVPIVKDRVETSDLQYDVLSALSSTKIGDLVVSDSIYQTDVLNVMIKNGAINDSSKSVLEAIGLLYIQDEDAGELLAEKVFESVDSKYNFGIWIGDRLVYFKGDTPYNPNNLEYIDSARQIISGVQEGKDITGFAARAYLAKTMNTKYYYFGGYVGDGNISALINYEGNISSAEIEVAISNNFDLYVNNNYVGNYNGSTSAYIPVRYIIPTNNFGSGNNIVEFRNSTNQSSIAGGFIKINYKSDIKLEESNRYYFPGIKGIVNIYDGFYLPGNINSINLRLNFSSSQNISLFIGNKSVYQGNSSGNVAITRDSNYLDDYLNYSQLSDKNIPIRIGMDAAILANSTSIGNADVVIVMDISGSMLDEIGGSGDGEVRDCNDPDLYDSDTNRISLAKCLVSNFSYNILNGVGNKVSIIVYSQSATRITELTSNFTLVNDSVTALSTSGSTCISCGLNEAYEVLKTGNSSRTRYVFVMTDGQANYRGAQVCNINSMANYNSLVIQAGDNKNSLYYNGLWNFLTIGSSSIDSYGVDLFNLTFGFKVGENGNIHNWTGNTWRNSQDINAGSNLDLYSVSIYNSTLAFAVGENGNIHNWTGNTWRSAQDLNAGSNLDFRGVDIYNSTLAIVVGEYGNVYNWSGSRWSNVDINAGSNLDLYSVSIYNSTLAFAVGENGYIYRWNGAAWSAGTDINTGSSDLDLYSVSIYNSTLAFAVGENGYIYRWNGGLTWSEDYNGHHTFFALSIVNSTLAYASGYVGALLTTWDGTGWTRTFPDYMFNSTGIDCASDVTSCGGTFSNNGAAALANISSFRNFRFMNATVHSVGFSLESCDIGNKTVVEMAKSGNGTYFVSSDPSALNSFFNNLSFNLYNLSFREQKSSLSGNIFSILHPDSYIEFDYDEPVLPTGIRFSIEKKFTTNHSNEEFNLLSGDSIIEARLNSYSAAKWTDKVYLNNTLFYNLTYYGTNFTILGDPFNIYLPKNMLNLPGSNRVNLTLYPAGVPGSLNNSIIYTVVRNITAYSNIGFQASGCNWTIKTESNGVINMDVPTTYTGTKNCYYNATSPNYEDGTYQDVYILATYSLLKQLDANNNGEIDINLEKDFFEIDTSTISGIPFEWRTEVSVRVWK